MSLEFGCTPWDNLSKNDLLRVVQKQYAALVAARTVLRFGRIKDPESPFWRSPSGTGGRALEMVEQCQPKGHTEEEIYRSFFRYAIDLLFSPEIGSNWKICGKGHLLGSDNLNETCFCGLPMSPIEWKDLTTSQEVFNGAPK